MDVLAEYYNGEGFDADAAARDCSAWIRRWFAENGRDCTAVVGLSGGKDSAVVCALCAEALGPERVLGVLMPAGVQPDIDDAVALARHVGVEHVVVNVGQAVEAVLSQLSQAGIEASPQTRLNLPARIRMSALYAVSQSRNGRVANTCNLSEDWVGYSTRYGDGAGDFSPLASFTVGEVRAIGHALGLPARLVDKPPADGLSGKTDEDALGFTYDVLDRYIRFGECDDDRARAAIDARHAANLFKLQPMPKFVTVHTGLPIVRPAQRQGTMPTAARVLE